MDIGKALMDAAPTFFALDYGGARAMFLEACKMSGAEVREYRHPLRGPQGETLAIDVGRIGPRDASKLALVISGTHGVEGLAGSGCQVAWLKLRNDSRLPPDTAVLLIHMLNPWGCAWHRRQTEDNVDLNRNFRDFSESLPPNPLYEAIHPIVVKQQPVIRAASDPSLTAFRQERGDQALAAALFSGQYAHNDGVGFGGSEPSWSNRTIAEIVETHALAAKQVMVIDLHTGLGPYGYGTLVSADPPRSAELTRARAVFGPGVISVADEATVPYEIRGNLLSWASSKLSGEITCVALEFGTLELAKLLELQVDDCRRRLDEAAWSEVSEEVRSDLIRFFFPATVDWMQSLVMRSLQVIHQSIDGLQHRSP